MAIVMDAVREFVIRKVKFSSNKSNSKDLEWLCFSLGLISSRDKEKTSMKIFNLFLDAAAKGKYLTTDDIAEKIGMTRGAVIHHLNRMIDLGLIIQKGGKYALRTNNLEELIDEIEQDVRNTMKIIKKISEDIDKNLRLPIR